MSPLQKKIGWGVLAALAAFIGSYSAYFYQKNLKGAGAAFGGPPADIAQVINTTGMPLKLPPGFSISIFAKGLGAPRVLLEVPAGSVAGKAGTADGATGVGSPVAGSGGASDTVLLASIPSQGRVVALPDKDKNGVADEVVTVASGLNRPHGLAYGCEERCELYIAETDQVASYDYDPVTMKAKRRKILAKLPGGGNHFTRTLLLLGSPGPAERLLVSVGSSCNVCNEGDPRRARVLEVPFDGSELKPFATGLRNAVFLKQHPETGAVWVTEMGRDLLGDDLPPDEINIIEEGKNYGWPICYGKNLHDTNFDKKKYALAPCAEPFTLPSYIDLPAHVAPLGLDFFPSSGAAGGGAAGSVWPSEFADDLLVAYHGSWNRTAPTGYKVVRFKLDSVGQVQGVEDFISGWLTEAGALGRPADVLVRKDGVIYISDDKAGVVYWVTYGAK